jgi:hypothetical protein
VAGPRSVKTIKLRVQRDQHRIAQSLPLLVPAQQFQSQPKINQKPKKKHPLKPVSQSNISTVQTTNRLSSIKQENPAYLYGGRASRRVSRGSVTGIQTERLTLENIEPLKAPPSALERRRLDSLSVGYWHAIRFSRIRAIAPQNVDSGKLKEEAYASTHPRFGRPHSPDCHFVLITTHPEFFKRQ